MAKRFHGSRHSQNDPKERFCAKYFINPANHCWEWTAVLNEWGYGQFKYERKMQLAHRVSYVLHKGEIPDGLLVCHECDNPKCVNPDHLFLGTSSDNARDRNKKNRQHKMKHPSITAYGKGCRCEGCKITYAAYQKNYKANKSLSLTTQ